MMTENIQILQNFISPMH